MPRLLEILRDQRPPARKGASFGFLNLYSYYRLRSHPEAMQSIDYFHVDGITLVVLLNALFRQETPRLSFDMTSLAPSVFEDAVRDNKSIYIIGSQPKVLSLFIRAIRHQFPGIRLAGSRHGYFDSDREKEQTIETICTLRPDIVVAGMGTPLQEAFLGDLRRAGWNGTGYTCGGFIHQSAWGLDYYPELLNRLNLRWLYRLLDEPPLARRYFFAYPYSVLLVLWDFARLHLKR